MKKIFSILIFCAAIAAAQTNRFPPINLYSGDPTGQSCPTANTLVQSTTTGGIYSCIGGIWTYGSGTMGGTYGPPVKSPHLNPWVLTGTQNQFLLAEYNLDSYTITLPTCSSATRQIISIDLLPNNNTTNTVTVDAGTLPIYDGSEPSPMGTTVAFTAVNGIATFSCNAGGHELSWVLARPTTLANLGAYDVPAAGGSWLIPPGLDPTGATDNSAQINAYIATQLDGTFGSRLTVYLPPGKYYAPGLSNIYGVKFEGPGIILKSINQPESGLSTATQGLQMSTSYSYAHRLVFGQEYMSHWMAIAERNISASQTIQSIAVTTGGSYTTCPTGIGVSAISSPGYAMAVGNVTCTGTTGNYAVSGVSIVDGGNYGVPPTYIPQIIVTGATGTGAALVGTWGPSTIIPINATFSGDSTTSGFNTDGIYAPDFLFGLAAGTVPGVTTVNAGHSGENSADWLTTYLPADQATNPDVYVLRWGVNDSSYGADGEIANIRQGLACIRNGCSGVTAKSVDQETIVLETPSSVNNYPQGRDPIYEEQLRDGFAQAARDYQAVFIDLYGLMADNDFAVQPCMMDLFGTGTPPQHVHPGDCKTPIYNKLLVDTLIGPLNSAYGSEVQNIPAGTAIILPTMPPTRYPKGVSLFRGTVEGGWPFDGAVYTVVQRDGVYLQFNYAYNNSSSNFAFRTLTAGGAWNAWSYANENTSFTATGAGSDSIAAGPFYELGRNQLLWQLGASQTMDMWAYSSLDWAKAASFDKYGNLVIGIGEAGSDTVGLGPNVMFGSTKFIWQVGASQTMNLWSYRALYPYLWSIVASFDKYGNLAANVISTNGVLGAASAPSGSCTTPGQWVFSQDGAITRCLSSVWTPFSVSLPLTLTPETVGFQIAGGTTGKTLTVAANINTGITDMTLGTAASHAAGDFLSSSVISGLATLSAGTVTVSNAAACTPSATCVYKLTNCGLNSSTAVGVPAIGTVVGGTSFVINSYTALAAIAVDSSKICWQIN
jgi:hypothetical protein